MEYFQEKERVENIISDLEREIVKVVTIYDSVLNVFKGLEKEIEANYRVCISKYRVSNQRNRSNKSRPASWKEIVPLRDDFIFYGIEELDKN